MKIAVSGGSGFIGRALVEALAGAGHEVVVLTRRPEAVGTLPTRATATLMDPNRVPPENLGGAEAVVNLAGENLAQRWTERARERILQSRLEVTRALVAAAREAGTVKAFVSGSAVGYYGNRGAEPLTESSPPGDDFLAGVCRQWETAAHAAQEAGMRLLVLRIGVVLHPSGGALAKMLPAFRAGVGGRLGSGEQYMSWVHREDLLRMIRFALETPSLSGPFNVTAPEPVTNRDFSRALARVLRRPSLLPAPAFALRAVFGEMASTILEGQRVLPERALNEGFTFAYPHLEQALANLLGRARAA